MSEDQEERQIKEGNKIIKPNSENNNLEEKNSNYLISQIQDEKGQLLAEDIDFFQDDSEPMNHIDKIGEGIEEIKKNKENELEDNIRYYIQDLEEFTNLFYLKDLINDPNYTIKLFMKSLKKIIGFQNYFTKFTIPKDKNDNKENEREHQKGKINTIDFIQGDSSNRINNMTKKKNKQKKGKKEDKNQEEKDITENQKDKNEIKKEKEEKNDDQGKIGKDKEKKNDLKKIKKIENLELEKEEMKKKTNSFEKTKSDFISKLTNREKKGVFSNQLNWSNSELEEEQNGFKNKSEGPSNIINYSSKEPSKNESCMQKTDNISYETFSKLEEYKSMNYDNILSIINNNANIDEEDLLEGKSYESKVRKYFQIVLDICSEKFFSVYKNSSTSIQSLYKFYEDLIEKDITKRDENISGNSKKKSDYNKLEFDLMVDHVNCKVIGKMIKIFKSSILAKNFDESNKEIKDYQIVGEVAKNLLNQSIDKYKQIGKIIDVLLIDQYLTSKKASDPENQYINDVIQLCKDLKLNLNENKFIFLFTNGSFLELKKAILFKEEEINNSNIDYDSLNIKTVFLIMNKKRYGKNILYLKKIIKSLNCSKIPYILFYIGDELNNGIEQILINHIKKSTDKNEYKTIISNIQKNENIIYKNISQSFIIRSITKSLKILNKTEIFNIIMSVIDISQEILDAYFEFLYNNLIEKKTIKKENYIIIFFISGNKIPSLTEKIIYRFNKEYLLTHIELIYSNEKDIPKKESLYSDKKVLKKYIIYDEERTKLNKDNIKKYAFSFEIIEIKNFYKIDFGSINTEASVEIIKNYILSHFAHFSEEKYMDFDLLHKKIILDIKNLEKILPIKCKQIDDETKFIDKAKELLTIVLLDDIIKSKSEEIFLKIKNCIGDTFYNYFIKFQEKAIKDITTKNLKKIVRHIYCFIIYNKFFSQYLSFLIK